MKYLSILIVGFITLSCCFRIKNEDNEIARELPIDSVVYIAYKKNKNDRLAQYDTINYVNYYHLLKGNNGYFYFGYDYIEQIGKSYKYAYQIFPQQNILKYFNNEVYEEYEIDLKLIDSFTISVNNIDYKIEKYYTKYSLIEDSSFQYYHYVNDELGIIAIGRNHYMFIATQNSVVDDSTMTYISKKIIENIE